MKLSESPIEYTESQKKVVATAHTVIAFAEIVAIVAIAAWLFLKGLSFAAQAVIPVAVGFFLALFFKPYYLWLEKKVRVPFLALIIMLATIIAPIVIVFWWAGAVIVNEITGLAKQIPEMINQAFAWLASCFPNAKDIIDQSQLAVGKLVGWGTDACNVIVSSGDGVLDAGGVQAAEVCSNIGDSVSNVVTATLNADGVNAVTTCTNYREVVTTAVSNGLQTSGNVVEAIGTNCDATIPQTAINGLNVNTEKLSQLYATYGDQIKKVGSNLIHAGYDKFGKAVADGSSMAVASTASSDAVSGVGYGKLGLAYASVSGALVNIGSSIAGAAKGAVYILVTGIFFVYFLMTKNCCGGKLAEYIPMLKDKTRRLVANQIDTLIDILVSFYQRQILICLIEGCFYGVGFWLVGLPYGFFIGLALGLLNLIPFFGSIVCLPVAIPFAYFCPGGSGLRVLLVLVVWGLGQLLDGYCITPKIQGNKTGLGYAGVIFSFLFWAMILGPLLGMLLAIPLSACCVVIWRTFCDVTKSTKII